MNKDCCANCGKPVFSDIHAIDGQVVCSACFQVEFQSMFSDDEDNAHREGLFVVGKKNDIKPADVWGVCLHCGGEVRDVTTIPELAPGFCGGMIETVRRYQCAGCGYRIVERTWSMPEDAKNYRDAIKRLFEDGASNER